jgi:hypothetical protein
MTDFKKVASGIDSGSDYRFYSCASKELCSNPTKTFNGITANIICCSSNICNNANNNLINLANVFKYIYFIIFVYLLNLF